jgi:hypothetical protein
LASEVAAISVESMDRRLIMERSHCDFKMSGFSADFRTSHPPPPFPSVLASIGMLQSQFQILRVTAIMCYWPTKLT